MNGWVSQAAWLSARHLSHAISSVGDLIAPGVSYLIIYLRSSLGLPTEVDPDRIYQKEKSQEDSISQDLTFLRLLCSADILSRADSRVRMLAIQKREFQPCLDSCNPSTCLPTGNPSVSVRIAFAELEHTHTHTDIADCHSRHVTSRSGGQFRFVSIVCLDMKSRSCQPENCRDVPGVSVSVGLN